LKVTAFNGSPRGRKSNSHLIVEPLLEGARQAGAQVEEVFLIEKDIKHCRGCFTCWGKTPGRCAIKDDMAGLIDLLLTSDYAGMATPVYGMYMTGLLKDFYDRLLPLSTPHIHRNDDGSFYHEGRVRRFPRMFFIFNSGFPGEHTFELLQALVNLVKRGSADNVVLEIYRNCGEALGILDDAEPSMARNLMEFRRALTEAGRQIVVNGRVSQQTVDRLHIKLMSDEEYMAGANRLWDQTMAQVQQDGGNSA
jgi:multimeric flavodoxin WrbA